MLPPETSATSSSASIASAMAATDEAEELSRQFDALNRRLNDIEFKLAVAELRRLVETVEAERTSQDSEQVAAPRDRPRRMVAIARDLREVACGTKRPRVRSQARSVAVRLPIGHGARNG